MSDAQSLFKKHFRHTPTHVVQAPGRLEVLGNHTDYNNGLVMAVAVDKYIYIAASTRSGIGFDVADRKNLRHGERRRDEFNPPVCAWRWWCATQW